MPRLSYRDFEGITIDEFIEHCKQLDGEGLVEAHLGVCPRNNVLTDMRQ